MDYNALWLVAFAGFMAGIETAHRSATGGPTAISIVLWAMSLLAAGRALYLLW